MAVHFLVRLLLLASEAAATAASSTLLATNATDVVTFSFSRFVPAFGGANLMAIGDANINQGALQITPDSINNASHFLTNKIGRVLYSNPFKFWAHGKDAAGGKRVASFSAVFTVNVYRPNGTEPAEGVAFVIAPSAHDPPRGSFGGYLGLTNAATDGDAANRVVAVELDTEKQP